MIHDVGRHAQSSVGHTLLNAGLEIGEDSDLFAVGIRSPASSGGEERGLDGDDEEGEDQGGAKK